MSSSISMTASELRDLLDRGEPVTVVDVRPAAERAEWAIPGSIHIDAYDALWKGDPDALAGLDLPADRPVATVCAAGRTSLLAALQLRRRGIEARSLSGGMKSWSLAWNSAVAPVPSSSATVVQVRRTGKGCLSYLVGSAGEAAVIDASVDPAAYLDLARQRGWRIRQVIDTHIHADHLSRSRALAELADAVLCLPEQERAAYPYAPIADGDTITIGASSLVAIRTPGHTFESTSYLLDQQALFTGDTLFLDAVGRPDLEADAEQARVRAGLLHGSLQRLTTLPPETIVLPGHISVPAPFDGEPLWATIADVVERVALLRQDEASFVDTVLGRIPPTPPNHHLIVNLNEAGLLPGSSDQADLEAGANRCAVA